MYLVDARKVLHPPMTEPLKVDWSSVGVFDEIVDDEGDDVSPSNQDSIHAPTAASEQERHRYREFGAELQI